MSQPEPALSDRGDSRRALPPEPPQVDWEAVRRGCPCGTCEAARRGGGAAEAARQGGLETADAGPGGARRHGGLQPAEIGSGGAARQDRNAADEPSAPASDPGAGAALEARIAALERRLDARLAGLESRVDALLRHAAREETAGAPEEAPRKAPEEAARGETAGTAENTTRRAAENPSGKEGHEARKEAPRHGRAPRPLDAAADAIARFVRDVENVLDDLSGPGRRPRS